MNHIKFMLNRINDYSLLHEEKEELDHGPFGGLTTVRVDCDHTKEYCQSVIDDVTTAIVEIKEYKVTSKNPLKKTADTQKRGFVLSKVNHQQ